MLASLLIPLGGSADVAVATLVTGGSLGHNLIFLLSKDSFSAFIL